MYYLPFGIVYLLLPFHFVLASQNELRRERHRNLLAVLTGDQRGITPRGTLYIGPWILGLLLALVGLWAVFLMTNLFDHLLDGSFKRLFMFLIILKTFIYFAFGVECLLWYRWAIDELKRESLAAVSHTPPQSR